ncbi:hypothetical protein ONE63_004789 [Megalurothrips usitatus]|uniref:Inner centromere protein ARK-binding domain-containing protein n=1 Tax=Megalurothrips usitatus TaxID=439358 RepID=A0AAV7X0T3_9NEOP|nr:hypothetical protein ONE63_004789 [Megalurothrips usitatus]
MPLSQEHLADYVRQLRAQCKSAVEAQEEDWQRTKAWADGVRELIRTGDTSNAPFLFPKTPKKVTAAPRVRARQLSSMHEDDEGASESQVTSTVNISCPVDSESRRTLRSRKIKVEVEEPEVFEDNELLFKIPTVPLNNVKPSSRSSTRSSKRIKKAHGESFNHSQSLSENPHTSKNSSVCSEDDAFPEMLETPRNAKKVSATFKGTGNKTNCVEETPTASKGGISLLSGCKESIGANSTYVKESVPKESIGANSTYVKESVPKESIGANSTYVKESVPKESIGANSTYVKESVPKESIGANSTYVKESVPKESIGANSTYVKESGPKESIGAISTYVKESGPKENIGFVKATMKAARKSLTRAKMIAVNKTAGIECNPGKVWCQKPHDRVSKCSKPVHLGHYRSISQCESSPARVPWGNAVSKSASRHAIYHSAIQADSLAKKKTAAIIRKPLSNEDRFQALVSNTLKICGPKSINEKKTQGKKNDTHALKNRQQVALEAKHSRELEEQKKKGAATAVNKKEMNGKVMQETSFKDSFMQKVTDQGFSHLASTTDTVKQGTVPQTAPSKCLPVLKADVPSKLMYDASAYDITLDPEDRPPLPSKGADDYGLDDVQSDESSDDESKPKKVVPPWAQAAGRRQVLCDQYYISHLQTFAFFGSKKTTPDLAKIFTSIDKRILSRRSSAVWVSPDKRLARRMNLNHVKK